MKNNIKIRYKTWYWGNYVYSGATVDSSRVTLNSSGFELYDENTHGWHNSEEYKTGYKLEPYTNAIRGKK